MNKYRSLVNGFPANKLFTMLSVWHAEVDMFLPWTPPLQEVAPVFFFWPTPITLPYKWHSSHPHRAAFSSWLPCFFFSESPSSPCPSWSLILTLVINSNFLFLFVYLLVCVCACVCCVCMCVHFCACVHFGMGTCGGQKNWNYKLWATWWRRWEWNSGPLREQK